MLPSLHVFGQKHFTGILGKDSEQVDVKFQVAADESGELHLVFDRFPLNATTRFIKDYHETGGTRFVEFSLNGTANDGTNFTCDNLIMTALAELIEDGGLTICPIVHYSQAHLTQAEPRSKFPVITWRLKGFECFHPLSADCSLGKVELGGVRKLSGEDKLTGLLSVTAEFVPTDLEVWKVQARALCDHVRHIMSFAVGTYLPCPIHEFASQNEFEVEFYSQSKAEFGESAAFPSLGLHEIFKSAVEAFFSPPIQVENLFFAIRWFVMRPHYAEAMLISSMTVLENLIDSNLNEEDKLLMSEKRYEKLRKKISVIIKEEIKEWEISVNDQPDLIKDLNNRLVDLKRRSLIDKIMLLSKRWRVQLDDIPASEIAQAKKARDHVVHRGFYEPKVGEVEDMHDHVLTVREIIVRFILTVLGFKGWYWSYRGGYHSRALQAA